MKAATRRLTRALGGFRRRRARMSVLKHVVKTVVLFATVGRGTLAPWAPPERLVVRGVYRRVRNPMISGVLSVLCGEALLFGSVPLLEWFGAFLLINLI